MTLTIIRAEARRLLGGITTTEYSDADLDQAVSNYYHSFIVDAMISGGEWQVQGEEAITDIKDGQKEYVLTSSTLIQLHRVEVNLTGIANNWTTAQIVDMRSKPGALSNTTNASFSGPQVRIFDNSLFFVDTPNTDVTGGLKIYFSDEPAELTASVEPNLPENLHIGLVYGACFDFAITKNLSDEQGNFKVLLNEKIQQLKEHYALRLPAKRTKLTPRAESYS